MSASKFGYTKSTRQKEAQLFYKIAAAALFPRRAASIPIALLLPPK